MLDKNPRTVIESAPRRGFLDAETKRMLVANGLVIVGTILHRIGEQMANSPVASEQKQLTQKVIQNEQSTEPNPRGEHDPLPQNNRLGVLD